MFGFYRVSALSPKLFLGNIQANVEHLRSLIHEHKSSAFILFPELSLTGYSLQDLFFQENIAQEVIKGLEELAGSVMESVVIVGAPLWYQDRLYNCAVVLHDGKIRGIVPKTYLANYREFYEKRWFSSGKEIKNATLLGAPFGVDLLFEAGEVRFGIEICEDLWSVVPPSFFQAAAGAQLLFNLSASDELVGKHAYRKQLVQSQSARCVAAYVYASSGPGESSADLCYSGATMIAENGALLAEGERFVLDGSGCVADIDIHKLRSLRRAETSFADAPKPCFRIIELEEPVASDGSKRYYDPRPFVPSQRAKKDEVCSEIFAIQSTALARRIAHIGDPKLVIGVSGGLDSTLALLVCVEACKKLGKPFGDIVAISMPGPGTTQQTRESAQELCEALGVSFEEIPITEAVQQHLGAIGHNLQTLDVTYENAQARERTQILMDKANMVGGIVVGTGDLSEIALGFATYNGDHMAMYHVNAGVPKTLVRYVIEWVASQEPDLAKTLLAIIKRPISPELLPPKEGEISQKTEQIIGPYELHDFFLYHFIKYGARPKKLLHIAKLAFGQKYSQEELGKYLEIFLRRFFANQFKRDAMPDGVKVGTIALSPRGDWRMASDMRPDMWMEELDNGND